MAWSSGGHLKQSIGDCEMLRTSIVRGSCGPSPWAKTNSTIVDSRMLVYLMIDLANSLVLTLESTLRGS